MEDFLPECGKYSPSHTLSIHRCIIIGWYTKCYNTTLRLWNFGECSPEISSCSSFPLPSGGGTPTPVPREFPGNPPFYPVPLGHKGTLKQGIPEKTIVRHAIHDNGRRRIPSMVRSISHLPPTASFTSSYHVPSELSSWHRTATIPYFLQTVLS